MYNGRRAVIHRSADCVYCARLDRLLLTEWMASARRVFRAGTDYGYRLRNRNCLLISADRRLTVLPSRRCETRSVWSRRRDASVNCSHNVISRRRLTLSVPIRYIRHLHARKRVEESSWNSWKVEWDKRCCSIRHPEPISFRGHVEVPIFYELSSAW